MTHYALIRLFCRTLIVGVFCIIALPLNAKNTQETESQPLKTKMNVVTERYDIRVCKEALETLAHDIFGIKEHKVLLENVVNKNLNQQVLRLVSVLNYHDRNAHVRFTATPHANGSCDANYVQTLVVQVTCIEAREEVLKKWLHKGRLDENTHVYQHRRYPTKMAYTSPANRGASCLITTTNTSATTALLKKPLK